MSDDKCRCNTCHHWTPESHGYHGQCQRDGEWMDSDEYCDEWDPDSKDAAE